MAPSTTLAIHTAAAAAIARANGQKITFLPGGDTGAAFDCRGFYNPKPITRTLEGIAITTTNPTAWIREAQLFRLSRDPQAGEPNSRPDYLLLRDGTTHRIIDAKLQEDGWWVLEMTNSTI